MMRETYGATTITRVATGRMSSLGYSHGRCPGGIWLTAGRKPAKTVVANRMTSRSPTTNSGRAATASIELDVTLSKVFSRRRAAYDPITMDNGIEMTADKTT